MNETGQSPNPPAHRRLPAAMAAHKWQPGQSGNPRGHQGEHYREVLRLAREASPRAIERAIELMDHHDGRVALVAIQTVLDRGWGKPRDIDPNASAAPVRPDLSALSEQDRSELGRIVGKLRGGPSVPPAAGVFDAGSTAADAGRVMPEQAPSARR